MAGAVLLAVLLEILLVAGAFVINLLTSALPKTWLWTQDWRVLALSLAVLVVPTLFVAGLIARRDTSETDGPDTGLAETIQGLQIAESGSTPEQHNYFAPVTQVHQETAAPAIAPQQIVVGEIPRRSAGYVDRHVELTAVEEVLASGGPAVLCAVTGLRGVGKTQLASEYARRRIADGWTFVAWANGESLTNLTRDLAEVAERVGQQDPDGDSHESAKRLRDWLNARREPGLLVIDNAVNPGDVRPLLPSTGQIQVVITTTDHSFHRLGTSEPVDVGGFEEEQANDFLLTETGRSDEGGAERVAAELGRLPLALSQAAYLLRQRLSWTFDEYLRRLADLPIEQLLGAASGSGYPRGAAEAILLSLDAAADADTTEHLLDVLGVISVLSATGVERDLLARLPGVPVDDVDDVLARAVGASLLTRTVDGTAVVMHRLVGRVIRQRSQSRGALGDLVGKVAVLLDDAQIPEIEAPRRRQESDRLIDHVESAWRANSNSLNWRELCVLRSWSVRQLRAMPDLPRAIDLGRAVLADCVRVLGEDHPSTLMSRNNLAYAYESAGDLGKAVPLYEATLADCVRVLGEDHPSTLTSRNNLAGAYESAGDLGKAVPLFEATLADSVRVLGEDHPDTLTSRNNLAGAYESAGDLGKAVPLYEATLADSVRVLGEDHPSTLMSRNNLAYAYRSAGDLGKAVPMFEATLADCVRVLGEDHPSTLTSRNNLAYAYRSAGDLGKAVPLYEATLADRVRVLGEDHPDTLTSRNNLAGAYRSAGDLGKAVPLYEATLADCVRVLGDDHPLTKTVAVNLDAVRRQL